MNPVFSFINELYIVIKHIFVCANGETKKHCYVQIYVSIVCQTPMLKLSQFCNNYACIVLKSRQMIASTLHSYATINFRH